MWAKVTLLLLLGYLSMTRSFAYLGLPTYKVFIGEVVLVAALLFIPTAFLGYWLGALFEPTPLSKIAWALLVFIDYGIMQSARGIYLGYPLLTILQNFVFNLYPLYLFLGLWVGVRRARFLPDFIRLLAWWNGLYGVAYIFFLNRLPYVIPGSPGVAVFGQPAGSAVAIIGLVLLGRELPKRWFLLLLNTFVMLAIQVRAEWLGFLVGLLLLAWLGRRRGRVAVAFATVAALLIAGYLLRPSWRAPATRGGAISTQEIVGRAIAPLSLRLASQLSENAESYAGTFSWRTRWWEAIWESTHDNPTRALTGHGYGYPLFSLAWYLHDPILRTPHNVFFYALGYTGWVGVWMFLLFQATLAGQLWRAYRLTGQPFGLVCWAMILAGGLFGNVFETPFGAIPFYLITGLAIAPVLQLSKVSDALLVGTQPLPATRG